MWSLLRSGRLDEAIDMCRSCQQYWRAASLQGGAYSHITPDESKGNPTRNLWKAACIKLSNQVLRVIQYKNWLLSFVSTVVYLPHDILCKNSLSCVVPSKWVWKSHIWSSCRQYFSYSACLFWLVWLLMGLPTSCYWNADWWGTLFGFPASPLYSFPCFISFLVVFS